MSDLQRVADDNGHYDAVDSNSLTENDAHQILRTDSRSLHTSSKNTGSGCQYAPKTSMIRGFKWAEYEVYALPM